MEALDSDRAVKKLVIGLGFMSVISASDMCNRQIDLFKKNKPTWDSGDSGKWGGGWVPEVLLSKATNPGGWVGPSAPRTAH